MKLQIVIFLEFSGYHYKFVISLFWTYLTIFVEIPRTTPVNSLFYCHTFGQYNLYKLYNLYNSTITKLTLQLSFSTFYLKCIDKKNFKEKKIKNLYILGHHWWVGYFRGSGGGGTGFWSQTPLKMHFSCVSWLRMDKMNIFWQSFNLQTLYQL